VQQIFTCFEYEVFVFYSYPL